MVSRALQEDGVIQVSFRYARPLGLLLALAAVPAIAHSVIGVTTETCADPETLIAGFAASEPIAARAEFLRSAMHASAIAEGSVNQDGETVALEYLVRRSWDPKRLYHRPEQRLLKGAITKGTNWEWLEAGDGKLPIQSVEYDELLIEHHKPAAAYLLVYDGEPVSNPYWAQIRSSLRQLLQGRQPMTLYFVYGTGGRDPAATEARMRSWLVDAWRRHRSVCAS